MFKGFFGLLLQHKILTMVLGVVCAIIMFTFVSDADFLNTAFEGAIVYVNKNMTGFVDWVATVAAMMSEKVVNAFKGG